MKQPKFKSKNDCPNCGNRYWYLCYLIYDNEWDLVHATPEEMCADLGNFIALVDDFNCKVHESMDICSKCGIALTVYNYKR